VTATVTPWQSGLPPVPRLAVTRASDRDWWRQVFSDSAALRPWSRRSESDRDQPGLPVPGRSLARGAAGPRPPARGPAAGPRSARARESPSRAADSDSEARAGIRWDPSLSRRRMASRIRRLGCGRYYDIIIT
jgi:hypothetical protein